MTDFSTIFTPDAYAPLPSRERLIISVDGEQSQGKTHFGGTAPASKRNGREGILYQCFDKKSLATIEKFRNGALAKKPIAVKDYSFTFPPGMGGHCGFGVQCTAACERCQYRAKLVGPILQTFTQDCHAALESCRSVVWDHGGAVWEAIRFARFGRNSMIPQQAYGALNWEFEDLIERAYESDCNLIMLHRLGKEFVEKEEVNKSGETKKRLAESATYERKGAYSRLGFKVQAEVRVHFDIAAGASVGVIDKSQMDMKLCGKVIPNFDFFNLALELAPEADPGAWL